jgi:4a-hydroxytetrahydrobiopterin dehydratase
VSSASAGAFEFVRRSPYDNGMDEALSERTCTPCRGGIPPLTSEEARGFQAQAPHWQLRDDAHRIERTFRFANFREALTFVDNVGQIAEAEGHHPDISFGWGYATVSLSTNGGQDRPAGRP